MNLRTTLYAATAVLACLGTSMLAISELNYLLALLAVIVSASSWVLCDVKGWIRLQTWTSNLASFFALGTAIVRFMMFEAEERLLAIADLVCYLQFILQFREKKIRNLWMIVIVSFLQVSVAAALQTSVVFAFLLTAYLFTSVLFLLLFYLYREQEFYAERVQQAEATTERLGYGFAGRVRNEPTGSMRRELTGRVFSLGIGTLALAMFFFAVVPRIGQSKWTPVTMAAQRQVGFSTEINLTRSGEIAEDPEIVMRVKFFDAVTKKPYQLEEDPYFRGTVLTFYGNGRWRPWGDTRGFSAEQLPAPPSGGREGLILQEITIEPMSTQTLFACAPWFLDEEDARLSGLNRSQQLFRRENARQVRFSYSLLTPAFRNPRTNRPCDVIPRTDAPMQYRLGMPHDYPLLRMPEAGAGGDPLANLKQLAASIVAGIPENDVVGRARALEAHLRDSGRFQYTLYTPKRPKGIDPLEDFVVNDPRGHCEYFAGALTMMLRSVGIPARIVVGYHGAEWNVVGNFYVVRQSNAHSWVEAYVPPDQVPLDRITHESQAMLAQKNGGWLRLDPTTATDAGAAAATVTYWSEMRQVVDYLKFLWNNYVVGMDAATQQEAVYRPVTDYVRYLYRRAVDPEIWRSGAAALREYLSPSRWWPADVGLWSWQGGVTFSLLICLAWTIYAAVRFLRRRRRRPTTAAARSRPPGRPVDFYVRLEQVLAKQQLHRAPEQTQREFVQLACGELAESPSTRPVAGLPRRIVEAYYRVRFGGRTLDAAEQHDVDEALTSLSNALSPPTPSPTRPPNGHK